VHKFIYIKSKSTVRNTVDYSGQEKPFGNSPMRGPFGPLRQTVRGTRVSLGQEHCKNTCKHYRLSEGEANTIWDEARTVRPQARTVRTLKNQKNLKVMGSVKCIFSVLADRLGCRARPSVTALWGTDIPGSTRRQEGLTRGFGPIISQDHPFVG
jgi:hypothetical protein